MEARVVIQKNGPYAVGGGLPLAVVAIVQGPDHESYRTVRELPAGDGYALCRCGRSGAKPFCDGSHARTGFDGTPTADRAPYDERADLYEGPGMNLLDDGRCAFARFCHRHGSDAWSLTGASYDAAGAREAVLAAEFCPTGRLTGADPRTGARFEHAWRRGAWLLEDLRLGVSGPVFVHGGVPLESDDGAAYEARPRYALCRCGRSRNKPFCDAAHVSTRFVDGLTA
jgi:CDGSH-type Zn-finger protein